MSSVFVKYIRESRGSAPLIFVWGCYGTPLTPPPPTPPPKLWHILLSFLLKILKFFAIMLLFDA